LHSRSPRYEGAERGAILMIWESTILSRSNKQKENTTRSSTETELIVVDDALPTVKWAMI